MSYPWLGYAPHPTADELKAAEEKWTKELGPSVSLSPTLQPYCSLALHLALVISARENVLVRILILLLVTLFQLELFIKKSGGPFVGGAKPSIADFAIIGCVLNLRLSIPTSLSVRPHPFPRRTASFKEGCPHTQLTAPTTPFQRRNADLMHHLTLLQCAKLQLPPAHLHHPPRRCRRPVQGCQGLHRRVQG